MSFSFDMADEISLNLAASRNCINSGIILRMYTANERWRYNVTPSLIGWAHTRNDPWSILPEAALTTISGLAQQKPGDQGALAMQDIPAKLILNTNLVKSRSLMIYCSFVESFWPFMQSTVVSLPCTEQNNWIDHWNGSYGRKSFRHDDIIEWKHFPRCWPFVRGIHRGHKGQWRGALMFSLICVWINGWVNNREAGDLRRYRAHYDVTVMVRFEFKMSFGVISYIATTISGLQFPFDYCCDINNVKHMYRMGKSIVKVQSIFHFLAAKIFLVTIYLLTIKNRDVWCTKPTLHWHKLMMWLLYLNKKIKIKIHFNWYFIIP